ncbi:Poly(3-hydroxybutyrate) depolymerase [Frankia canadensis]|uniref:Poly(3-hydroxybutyrate) depolymerase n=1 Tax=Frankia canadensis TaxID=1836972 RepID=A0A2I2KQW6_9ACTN|nr:PHB depolymerase family esterase [Frankia canadensis]SNQ48040.1 Poly(3-hydroxybutyrate) depolymerase [Frankia canadensis]SOU55330.1 Poly(3-hydroxybutyrate) depolymerase [Frankia canadensis]
MACVPAVRRRRVTAVWLLTFLVPVLLAVTGCGVVGGSRRGHVVPEATPGATPTVGPDTFERSGRGSPVRITLPPPGTPTPYPLIVALHSLHYDGTDPKTNWDLDGLARAAGVAVVYPDGIGKSWNAGTCCDIASARQIDDVDWLRALVAHLSEKYPVDRRRISMVGLSNGAMLAYRYACEHGDELAGVAVVAGSRQVAQCHPAAPLTVVAVHGGQDGHVPYLGTPWSPVLNTAITPEEESLAPFRAEDRCPVPSAPGDSVFTDSYGVPWTFTPTTTPPEPDGLAAGLAVPGGAPATSAPPTALTPAAPAAAGQPPTGQASLPAAAPTAGGQPVAGQPVAGQPAGGGPVAVRRETRCGSPARVVQFLLPTMAHGWPPTTGPSRFATAGVLWNLLSPARSARPGPRM